MSTEPLKELLRCGQSYWLDNLTREKVRGGELRRRVEEEGLRGVTSNPAIFHKAISGGSRYDEQIAELSREGRTVPEIYEGLVVTDIREACDVLRAVWQESDGKDGFISLEVSPRLIHDTEASISEARRLWDAVDRPNVMIKIPGTPAGVPAIEELLASGINVNVTLLFSLEAYEAVARAYRRAMLRRREQGLPLGTVSSVASFFLSRIDVLVDGILGHRVSEANAGRDGPTWLYGRAGIASAKLAYRLYEEMSEEDEWTELASAGARPQRLLWASTSTKNPLYDPVRYVEPLVGRDTVNTMPDETISAFAESGRVRADAVREGVDEAREVFERLESVGIDMKTVTEQLVNEGAEKFLVPFDRLMSELAGARRDVLENGITRFAFSEAAAEAIPSDIVDALDEARFPLRLDAHDPTAWTDDPEAQEVIRNRLGWTRASEAAATDVDEILGFADEVREEGVRDVVVLGMGGSSLCPLVVSRTFPAREGWPRLHVLDDVDPAAVRRLEEEVDLASALFLVSSKSGSTVETLSLGRHFYELVAGETESEPGRRFVALTDPGSPLIEEAREKGFRRIFETPPTVGGRFSALTGFGLVPMALAGVDLRALLDSVRSMEVDTDPALPVGSNPGIRLGVALGALAKRGRDKITLLGSAPFGAFPLWVEQLLAESTGKDGTGLIPVVDEPLGPADAYGPDRVFVRFALVGSPDPDIESRLTALEAAGQPVIRFDLPSREAMGGEFLRWEIATATAGLLLGVNPFDQPNVEAAKRKTSDLLDTVEDGSLPEPEADAAGDGLEVWVPGQQDWAGRAGTDAVDALVGSLLDTVEAGDYVGVLAFFAGAPERDERLAKLREAIRTRTGAATCFGYGPRYLHSSGQLHKGGRNAGAFLLLTADPSEEEAIPGRDWGFGTLQRAEALGDLAALADRDRRVLRLHLGWYVEEGLDRLIALVS